MIRYKDTITITRTHTGAWTIKGTSQIYKTSAVQGHEPITRWWDNQHKSTLREYQKDLLIKLIPSAFKSLDYQYRLQPYTVYAEGGGYSQPHDVAFATLENHDTRITLLGTAQHTWIDAGALRNRDKITLHTEDAFDAVDTPQGQDQVWQLYDQIRSKAREVA